MPGATSRSRPSTSRPSLPRGITLRGEAALARVDLPDGLTDLLGSRQWGIHLDLVAPVWRAERGVLRGSILSVTTRLEHVDRNVGRFDATGQLIGDDLGAIVLGASLRPAAGTVLKVNLRREWSHDLLRNAASRRAALQFGIASYF
jgi:hypothetical protein